ncbi:hypothetical protein TcYC6_0048600 [Trypanosoma cruzi]|nr:hypothetical protein TcYC6_0048600 [Trypanosoma cruzi]
MDFGLANDPTQATRITNRNISSPDVTAYRVLRLTHWQFAPYMDSDHCLVSYLVEMDDGIPRLANTLPRREKATFALRKADWPAFTSLCEALLATASTWLDIRGGIVRAAERHIPSGSRGNPKTIWTHEMEQADSAAEAAHKAHTLPHPETAYFEPNLLENMEEQNQALRRGFAVLLEARAKRRGASPSPSWRYLHGMAAPHPHPLESVVLRTDLGCVCALPRKQANMLVRHFVRVSRVTLPYTAAAARRTPLPPGDWEMDRPFTPYELDVAIRDSLRGSAPGHDNMLNEFLHRLGPVARGTLRTMIHNSFANGSLRGSWKMGDAIPIPKPGKDPCRPVSYRPIKSLSVLLQLTEGMIHRHLSALLPHHPRQFGFTPPRSTSDVVALVIDKITRGLNEFSIVEYVRPGGGAPARHARRHRSWS